MDPDRDRHFVGPDLDPICLQRLSADASDEKVSPPPSLECVTENYAYFSTKTYVVGTQKNRFNETDG